MNNQKLLAMTLMIMGSVSAMESRLFVSTEQLSTQPSDFQNEKSDFFFPQNNMLQTFKGHDCDFEYYAKDNRLTEMEKIYRSQIKQKHDAVEALFASVENDGQDDNPDLLTVLRIFEKEVGGLDQKLKYITQQQQAGYYNHIEDCFQHLCMRILGLDRNQPGFEVELVAIKRAAQTGKEDVAKQNEKIKDRMKNGFENGAFVRRSKKRGKDGAGPKFVKKQKIELDDEQQAD